MMNSQNNDIFRIAIQKSGRLRQDSLDYLSRKLNAEISLEEKALYYKDTDKKIEYMFVREKDIPKFVSEGIADMGIVGKNTFLENDFGIQYPLDLSFSFCNLAIAIPEEQPYSNIYQLDGKTIATSYPNILQQFMKETGLDLTVKTMSGSVEAAPAIGYADGIFDIVDTGQTLKDNGLKEVGTILRSQAVAIFQSCYDDFEYTANWFNLIDDMLSFKNDIKNPAPFDNYFWKQEYAGNLCRTYS